MTPLEIGLTLVCAALIVAVGHYRRKALYHQRMAKMITVEAMKATMATQLLLRDLQNKGLLPCATSDTKTPASTTRH